MNDNRSTEPRTEANCPHTYLSCDDCEEGFTRRAIEAEAAAQASAAPDEGLREALETALVALEAVARQPDSAAIRVNASSVAYAIRRALPEDQS